MPEMEVIANYSCRAFIHGQEDIVGTNSAGLPLGAQEGHEVRSYRELLKKIAVLNYNNKGFCILFRGQSKDYRPNMIGDPGLHSSLYPSILRPAKGSKREALIEERFVKLARAEEELKDQYRLREVLNNRIIRWAILQHYEVCPTPLLDITSSLQTALSFALMGGRDDGYLYALAFPHLTGPVSISIESSTQLIDLRQVCPPDALRPHFQGGILAGDYPVVESRELSSYGKGFIANNFVCRLLTKFRLTNCKTWVDEGFTPTPEEILYPNADDALFTVTSEIKRCLEMPEVK